MNFSKSAVVLCLTALGLDGCAHYQPRPISAERSQDAFLRRSLADLVLKSFLEANLHKKLNTWPPVSWHLTALTLAAFFLHPDLDVARAQWGGAKAGRIGATERPNPALSLIPGYDTTTSVPSPWFPSLSIDIPIETAGKRGHRMAEAAQLATVARLNIASVAWRVRSDVRAALLRLYAA